jgi:hypothetical protein
MGELRYNWLRDKNNVPVACIASKREKNFVYFSIAAHNPIDKFSKIAGRTVAAVKFAEGFTEITSSSGNIKVNILTAITNNFFIGTYTSSRVLEAAKYRLKTYKPRNPQLPKR